MDIDVHKVSKQFQENHSIWDLGYLFQFLKVGMSRWEIENLLGKSTTFDIPSGNHLYEIPDLRCPIEVDGDEKLTIPVFLQVIFEGDEERKRAFVDSGNFESGNNVEEGDSADKLLFYAILPIGE